MLCVCLCFVVQCRLLEDFFGFFQAEKVDVTPARRSGRKSIPATAEEQEKEQEKKTPAKGKAARTPRFVETLFCCCC